MNMSANEYNELTKKASPKSPFLKNLCFSFLIGGAICMIGQGFSMLYQHMGADIETASAWCSITLVLLSVILTGLDLYDSIAKVAGAGTLVPITGFANAMSSAAIEFKSEGWILGVGSKIFLIAGPVIVYGISTSIVYGLIYYFLPMLI